MSGRGADCVVRVEVRAVAPSSDFFSSLGRNPIVIFSYPFVNSSDDNALSALYWYSL